ncbi:MAG: response regulator transcription factor [Bacteroidota bacterium]
MNLKALIVEDEWNGRQMLHRMIDKFCPELEVIADSSSVDEATFLLEKHQLDVVFLDIELPGQNGFALLDLFPNPSFDIIFTTAYDKYAVQAFRMSAVDYLLKPINFIHLREAVGRVKQKRQPQDKATQMAHLQENLQGTTFTKIGLPTPNGYCFIELDEIVSCEASRNYSCFYLSGGKKVVVAKPLKYYEKALCQGQFYRISRSHIINLQHLDRYIRTKGGEVVLTNGTCLALSETRREGFLQRIRRQ